MMFAAALQTLHRHPAFGVSGTFTPQGGSPVAVHAVETRHDDATALLGGSVRSGGRAVDLLVAEVATRPKQGDTITIDSTTRTVRSAELDSAGVAWRCDVD